MYIDRWCLHREHQCNPSTLHSSCSFCWSFACIHTLSSSHRIFSGVSKQCKIPPSSTLLCRGIDLFRPTCKQRYWPTGCLLQLGWPITKPYDFLIVMRFSRRHETIVVLILYPRQESSNSGLVWCIFSVTKACCPGLSRRHDIVTPKQQCNKNEAVPCLMTL